MPPPAKVLQVEEILPNSSVRSIYDGSDNFEEKFGVSCLPSPVASYTSSDSHSFEEKFVTPVGSSDTNLELDLMKTRKELVTQIPKNQSENQRKESRKCKVKSSPPPVPFAPSLSGRKFGKAKTKKSSQICPFIPCCGVSIAHSDEIRVDAHFRRYHEGLRKCYNCKFCGLGFTGYKNMMSHQKICQNCGVNENNWDESHSNEIQVIDVCLDLEGNDEFEEDEEILSNLSESNAKIANSCFPIVSLHRLKKSTIQRCSSAYNPESHVDMKRNSKKIRLKLKNLIKPDMKRTKTKTKLWSPDIRANKSKSKMICSERNSLGKQTNGKKTLSKRKRSDKDILLTKCPNEGCKFRFKPTEEHRRQAHVRRIHEGIKKCFVCDICQESFQYLKNWQSHTTEHTGVPIFVCRYCQKDCRHPAGLKLHTLKVHEPEKLKFKCEHCGKVFAFQFKLNDHMRYHKMERPYMCEICSDTFRFAHHLKQHQMKHEGVKCDICEETLANSRSLSLHITKMHSKSCDLKCTICEYGTNSKTEFKRHVQAKHSDGRSLKCHLCPSTFKTRSSLLVHLRRHADVRKYKCKTCGAAFVEKTGLTRHELIHSNAQSHVCQICGKTFPIKNYLHLHMRRHNKHIKHPTIAYRKKVVVIPSLDVTSEFDKASQMQDILTKTNDDCEKGLFIQTYPIINEPSICHDDILPETSLLDKSNVVFQDLS